MQETIIIVDFGSQYTQLIARRLRELNVYCEIQPFHNVKTDHVNLKGFVLSGSPHSVLETNAPLPPDVVFQSNVPILGVCYGAQHLAHSGGGQVQKSEVREYGRANLTKIDNNHPLMNGVPVGSQVWMSHGDTIKLLPEGYNIIASTEDVAVAAFHIEHKPIFGIQFHPEVYHSTDGMQLLSNFVLDICGCVADWTPAAFVEETVDNLKNTIGQGKVVMGLSGGVDSTVAAVLLDKAIGNRLHCIFVNNGLLRKNEFQSVLEQYKHMGLNVKGVDASERFLGQLEGVSEPEAKRKIIGRVFIEVFDDEANLIKDVDFLGQGTIYPDVIESVSSGGPSVTIKSHHNVGGLPDFMKLSVVEPLRLLFKDEVRRVGASLGIAPQLLGRHPFPGPGLAIRVLGEITKEKVRVLQEVDDIFIQGLREENLYDKVWQAGAILLPVQSVGVMGDERTYEQVVALRAVESTDGMTADWVHLPYEFLARVSNRIINRVKGVNRVVYDISSKPPATIEWE